MKRKAIKQQIKQRKVDFLIDAPGASRVILVGDFNKWDTKSQPMKNNGNSLWIDSIMIPPGMYEYKFLIDGEWEEDPENEQMCPNCFGTFNSVLNLR
jgi:1,4-alpha-glucan branching enzyme